MSEHQENGHNICVQKPLSKSPMFPWLFLWAPHYNYPWGGAVRQDFSLDAFFGSIAPTAGDGNVERAIFNYASYGRQIGTLSDAVAILLNTTDLSSAVTPEKAKALKEQMSIAQLTPEKASETIEKFAKSYKDIEDIKQIFLQSQVDAINRILQTLKEDELKKIQRAVINRLSEEQSKRR